MGASDQLQVVGVVELFGDVLTETVAGTTGRDAPAAAVIRIGPAQVANGTLVRDFHEAIQLTNLIEGVDTGRQTAMKAEDVALDDSREGQEVKERREVLPDVGVAILTQALVIETIHLSDLLGLVVTAKDGDTVGVAHLHANKQGHGLH